MTTEPASFQRVHVDEVVRLIDSGYQVVDVRDDREWSQGHIPDARHVTLAAILANPGIHNFKDKTIFDSKIANSKPMRFACAVNPAQSTQAGGVLTLPSPLPSSPHASCPPV